MGQDADSAVAALYRLHYRFLVGLAVLLVQDIATAEGLVQDSFVAMHSAWRRLEDATGGCLICIRRS
jgi:DNA-directed RNA polymerase specialized sigma24 family protein